MLDDVLLGDYLTRFITYGNREGRLWFLDVEDDRMNSFDVLDGLIGAWDASGRREEYRLGELDGLDAIEDSPYFDTNYPGGTPLHQPFSVKSRIACGLDASMPAQEPEERRRIRQYQATCLGTREGDTCLLDIVPIPYHPTSWWPHSEHTALPELRSKEVFESTFILPRLILTAELIDRYRPRALVSFCWRYREEIEHVFGPFAEELKHGQRRVRLAWRGTTLIVLTNDRRYHRSPSNAFCWWLGQEIAARLSCRR